MFPLNCFLTKNAMLKYIFCNIVLALYEKYINKDIIALHTSHIKPFMAF